MEPNLLAPERWPILLSGVVMLGLAAWLLAVRFEHPLNRAFALFLVLRGMMNLTGGLSGADFDYWERTAYYFAIALPLATLWFGVVHHRPAARNLHARAGLALLALAVPLELAYALDHGLAENPQAGPLSTFTRLRYVAYAGVALLFARAYARAPQGPRRASHLLAAVAFVLDPLFLGSRALARDLAGLESAGGFAGLNRVATELSLVPALLVALELARVARGPDPASRAPARRGLVALALPALTGVLLYPGAPGTPLPPVYFALTGLWTLALPLLVSYALLRHQLFDLDTKVQRTIRQSAIAGAFIAFFFVVSEAAEVALEEQAGPVLGLVAAGLLALALHPLQRGAERLARSAMPGVKPPGEMTPAERLALYREQLAVALEDGRMTDRERRLLELTRERLGLSPEDTARLEREVAAGGSAARAAA